MSDIDSILKELSSRLPELEWKISSLSSLTIGHSLPKGLFQQRGTPSGASCIAEIKADIQALNSRKHESIARFLAARIQQKIKVLVTLYFVTSRKQKGDKKQVFGLETLSTRKQWIQELEEKIESLTQQREAIAKTLSLTKRSAFGATSHKNSEPETPHPPSGHLLPVSGEKEKGGPEVVLRLQSDLGEVEQRLTLAKEALSRFVFD